MDIEVRNLINNLIETLKVGERALKMAAEDVESPTLKRTLCEYASQRAHFVQVLQFKVELAGEATTLPPHSRARASHLGRIYDRAPFSFRDDAAILEECERGEYSAEATYQQTLAATPDHARSPIIEEQFTEIRAAHDHIRMLRDSLQHAH